MAWEISDMSANASGKSLSLFALATGFMIGIADGLLLSVVLFFRFSMEMALLGILHKALIAGMVGGFLGGLIGLGGEYRGWSSGRVITTLIAAEILIFLPVVLLLFALS